jgi:hypothetical protein
MLFSLVDRSSVILLLPLLYIKVHNTTRDKGTNWPSVIFSTPTMSLPEESDFKAPNLPLPIRLTVSAVTITVVITILEQNR